MAYFDDLNPYLVRAEDSDIPETAAAIPVEQTYIENIFRLNIGKKGTFYYTYSGSKKWTDMSYTGIIEQAGRDHIVVRNEAGQRLVLLYVYLLWASFNEPLNYMYKAK